VEGDVPKEKRQLTNNTQQEFGAASDDGLKLLSNLEDNPICSVYVVEDLQCVAVMWKGYVTSAQLRFILENIIALLGRYGLHKLLGDDTSLLTIHEEDQKWIIEDWMPRAMAAGLRVIASRTSASYLGKLSTDHIKSVAPTGLLIRSFDSVDEARQWLKESA
jgi:hypothetical protein